MAPIGNKPTHKGKAVLAGGLSGAFEICWYAKGGTFGGMGRGWVPTSVEMPSFSC